MLPVRPALLVGTGSPSLPDGLRLCPGVLRWVANPPGINKHRTNPEPTTFGQGPSAKARERGGWDRWRFTAAFATAYLRHTGKTTTRNKTKQKASKHQQKAETSFTRSLLRNSTVCVVENISS